MTRVERITSRIRPCFVASMTRHRVTLHAALNALGVLAASLLTACAWSPHRNVTGLLDREMCAPPRTFRPAPHPHFAPLSAETRARLTERFSPPALDIAEIIGAGETLDRVARLEQSNDASALLAERARLATAINLAALAARSVVAELDCDHERMLIGVQSLRNAEESNTRIYTVASILVTAVTGIATSALTPVPGAIRIEAVLGIAGGAAGGALGVAALFAHPTLSFRHSRNLLRELWEGPAHSALWPDVVWAYLSDRRFALGQQHSLRENLVRGWRVLGRLGGDRAPTPRLVALFFGDGGRFDADELDALVAMSSELRAAVDLMEQDLLQLANETLAQGAEGIPP